MRDSYSFEEFLEDFGDDPYLFTNDRYDDPSTVAQGNPLGWRSDDNNSEI